MTTPEQQFIDAHPQNLTASERRQWEGQARRATDNVFIEMLEHNTERTEEAIKIVNELKHQFEAHARGEEALLARIVEGYPDNDPKAHRIYHESVMRTLQRKEKFRDAVIEKTLAGFVWSMMIGLGAAVLQYIKGYLK